jgi:predicted PurR-regulated permease PerM
MGNPMSSDSTPTTFQRKVCWSALTALAALVFVLVILVAGWSVVMACGYLKPVLTPIAIAAVLAYLLTPVVALLCKWRIPRTWAVILVFVIFTAGLALICVTIAPALEHQGSIFAGKIPDYSQKIGALAKESAAQLQQLATLRATTPSKGFSLEELTPESIKLYGIELASNGLTWVQEKLPTIASATGSFLQRSIGGVFGILGFLLSLVLVPVFLFFFLLESPEIASNWSRYLPLRASPLKEEIVSLFTEINDYLIHFFRGQLLVSLIDGAIVGISLFLFLRLDFSFLIGLLVGILCLIPYFGFLVCLIPAMLIALAQYGDLAHPLYVLLIFSAANWLEGIFISPKIVGKSVGLHPMTVILSVMAWTIVLGGLLGALLAVPLTATLKVLLRRYFWDRPASQASQQPHALQGTIEETVVKKTVSVEFPN